MFYKVSLSMYTVISSMHVSLSSPQGFFLLLSLWTCMYLCVWMRGKLPEIDPKQPLYKSPRLHRLHSICSCNALMRLNWRNCLATDVGSMPSSGSEWKQEHEQGVCANQAHFRVQTGAWSHSLPPSFVKKNSRRYLSSKTTRGHPLLWCFDRKYVFFLCGFECVYVEVCAKKETRFSVYRSLTD